MPRGGIVPGDEVAEPVVDLYRCPHCKVEEHTVFTNTGAQRAMRAPGHTQGAFGLESLMDELAAALDMDPLELRRKNYSTKNLGDTGLPYSSKGLDRCYEAGAKAIGWERRNRKPGEGGGEGAKGPLRRGIGMASSIWFGAGVPGTLADIVLYPDGSRRGRLRHPGPRHRDADPHGRRRGRDARARARRISRSRSAIPTIPGRRSRAAA